MTSDWEIKSRAHRCARSQKAFQDGTAIYTLLFRDKHGFHREDVCEDSWQEMKDSTQPFSFWKSRYEAPPPAAPEPLQKESVEELLRRLIHEDQAEQIPARYVLAIMLERKKSLKQVDVREVEDGKLLIYEHAKTGEVFIIPDPGLKLTELDQVQKQIYALLEQTGRSGNGSQKPV